MAEMKFSLVLATVGRTQELGSFLRSLCAQEYRSFEVIVVDQNPDDRLLPILQAYDGSIAIRRLVSARGLSRARNVGLSAVSGAVVAFPDDDCSYPRDLLRQVFERLEELPEIDGLTGRAVTENGASYARFDLRPGFLSKSNVWQRVSSFTMFLRRHVIEAVGPFDESLGLGSGTPWQGGEDIDYPLRAIEKGFCIYYDPSICVYHPEPGAGGEDISTRAYRYGAGIGRVWRKHHFPFWLVAYYLSRPIGGAVLSLAQGKPKKANYHWSAFRGRLSGWSAPL